MKSSLFAEISFQVHVGLLGFPSLRYGYKANEIQDVCVLFSFGLLSVTIVDEHARSRVRRSELFGSVTLVSQEKQQGYAVFSQIGRAHV